MRTPHRGKEGGLDRIVIHDALVFTQNIQNMSLIYTANCMRSTSIVISGASYGFHANFYRNGEQAGDYL